MKLNPALCVCLLGGAMPADAEELPVWPAHWMCAEADAIVLGVRVAANRVKVSEWIMKPAEESPAESIEILGLEKHDRMVRIPGAPQQEGNGKVLKSHRLICFLEDKGGRWRSLGTYGTGSSGLVWIEEEKCYRYEQWMNPGPFALVPYREFETAKKLRAHIQSGLADRAAWAEAQEIVHPQEKAIVLVSYLLARTSPEGKNRTYRSRVRQVLPKLGRHAVEELIVLLEGAQEGDQLGDAVLVLYDLGPSAQPAVSQLVTLLEKPELVHPIRVIEALGRIGDASVAHQLLPYLKRDELAIRAEVSSTMARFRYQDAAPLIAAALPHPDKVKSVDAYSVYTMLGALYELGPEHTQKLVKPYLQIEAMRHVQNLLEPFLDPPDQRE